MDTYNMSLPTPASEINVYIWFKYLLEDSSEYVVEGCFSQANNSTSLERRVQQMLSPNINVPGEKLKLSLQYFTCVWTAAMSESGAINRTEATSHLLEDIHANLKNASIAPCSILQLTSSRCLGIPWTGQDNNSQSSGMCVQIKCNVSSSSESDSVISNIKTEILTSLSDIAHQNNFLIQNVTLTNRARDLLTEDDTSCRFGRTLTFRDMPLLTHQNGTVHVDFNITTVRFYLLLSLQR